MRSRHPPPPLRREDRLEDPPRPRSSGESPRRMDASERAEPDHGRSGLPRRNSPAPPRSRQDLHPAFRRVLPDAGVATCRPPRRSPSPHAFAARGVRPVREERPAHLVPFEGRSPRRARGPSFEHFLEERNRQGRSGRVPYAPPGALARSAHGRIRGPPRLGGSPSLHRRKAGCVPGPHGSETAPTRAPAEPWNWRPRPDSNRRPAA